MLKKIDIYIIKKYLGAFFFTVLMFSMIAVIFNFSERVQKFIEHDLSSTQIIQEYYMNFIPWINAILFPIYALIAVVFITSRLAGNSEIIAIFSSGVSFWRLMRPYFIAAGIICGTHLWINHAVIPNGNKVMMEFENKYIFPKNVKSKNRNVHIFTGPETKVYVRYFRSRDTSAVDFRVEEFDGTQLKTLLKAKNIKWVGEPDIWRVKDYEIRRFNGVDEELLIGQGEELDTSLNFSPKDFVYYANQKEMMTTKELKEYIEIQKQKGAGGTRIYEVERHRRTADPFTVVILTMIGVAVAGRKVRGGMGLHLALGVVIGAVFIFLSKVSITFTTNHSFPPALGVWVPNIIFAGIAFYLIGRAQK